MDKCQRCNSLRLCGVSAECRDCCDIIEQSSDGEVLPMESGYVPESPIGGGDYLQMLFCLDCGQIQGTFPFKFKTFEEWEAEQEAEEARLESEEK